MEQDSGAANGDRSSSAPAVPAAIEGSGLHLAAYQPNDAAALWEAVEESRSRLEPWLRWPREVGSPAEAAARIARLATEREDRTRFTWGVFDADGRLLGEVAIVWADWDGRVFELGYWIRCGCLGRGVGRRAVAAVACVAFDELGANRVALRIEADNRPSQRLAEALGFKQEGTLRRERLGLDGEPTDVAVYSLIPGDNMTSLRSASGG